MGFVVEHFIPRTPKDVWKIITDWKVAEFWLGVEKLRPLDPKRRPAVGTKLTFLVRGQVQESTITKWEPPHVLGLSSTQGGVTAEYTYTFSESADGTRVQLEGQCSAAGAWRLLLPFVSWLMERTDRKQLPALEKLVRATTGSGK